MKIYVTGSLIQHREIRLIAYTLSTINGYVVRFVKSHAELNLEDCIKLRYDNIDWCDAVYILKREDGGLPDGVIYEKVYAQKQHKDIFYIN